MQRAASRNLPKGPVIRGAMCRSSTDPEELSEDPGDWRDGKVIAFARKTNRPSRQQTPALGGLAVVWTLGLEKARQASQAAKKPKKAGEEDQKFHRMKIAISF